MLPLLITEQSKQQEWNTISTIAQNNGLPAQTIHSLKKKLINKQQQKPKQNIATVQQSKKWIAFTYYSPLIGRATNIFKQTNLKIAFRATNTINHIIYKLMCNTYNNVYIG